MIGKTVVCLEDVNCPESQREFVIRKVPVSLEGCVGTGHSRVPIGFLASRSFVGLGMIREGTGRRRSSEEEPSVGPVFRISGRVCNQLI